MTRYEQIIGPGPPGRTLPDQQTETAIAIKGLNRMTQVGMPISDRLARPDQGQPPLLTRLCNDVSPSGSRARGATEPDRGET